MSLIAIDGFDHYAGVNTTDFAMKWDGYRVGGQVSIGTTNPRRIGGRHAVFDGHITLAGYLTKEIPVGRTVVVGMAVRFASLTDHGGFLILKGSSVQGSIYIESDGSIDVWRGYKLSGPVGAVLGSSAVSVITEDTWHYIEFKFYIDDSAGTYQVDVDGITVVSGTSADTKWHTTDDDADKITLKGCGGSTPDDLYIDDLYIDDSTIRGSSVVDTLWPDANGSVITWNPDPTSDDNYECVDDDNDVDEDDSYVLTALSNQNDSYGVDTLTALYSPETADEAVIHGLGITVCTKKDFVAAGSVYQSVFDGVTHYVASNSFDPENGTYTMDQEVWETQPHESGTPAWDETGVNGTDYGIRSKVALGDQYLTQLVVEVLRENGDQSATSDAQPVVVICA